MTSEVFPIAFASLSIIPAAAAARVDWRTHHVPNALVALMLVPAVLALMLPDQPVRLVAMVVGAGLMATPILLVHLATPAAMGFGDVKLAGALGAVLGVLAPQLALLALAAGAGLTLLVACCRRSVAVAFAPGLVAGTVAALALGSLEGWKVAL